MGELPQAREAVRQEEHLHQVALFEWAEVAHTRWPSLGLLYAIPNGGHRNKATAGRLKAEGVKAGVPDICLPVARCRCNALYIELKAPGGRLSKAQEAWFDELTEAGNCVMLAIGWEEARDVILDYLGN